MFLCHTWYVTGVKFSENLKSIHENVLSIIKKKKKKNRLCINILNPPDVMDAVYPHPSNYNLPVRVLWLSTLLSVLPIFYQKLLHAKKYIQMIFMYIYHKNIMI